MTESADTGGLPRSTVFRTLVPYGARRCQLLVCQGLSTGTTTVCSTPWLSSNNSWPVPGGLIFGSAENARIRLPSGDQVVGAPTARVPLGSDISLVPSGLTTMKRGSPKLRPYAMRMPSGDQAGQNSSFEFF